MIVLDKEKGFRLLKKLNLRKYLEHVLSNPCKKYSLIKDFKTEVMVAVNKDDFTHFLYETSEWIFDEQDEGTYETWEFFILVYKNGKLDYFSYRRLKNLYDFLPLIKEEKESLRFIGVCSIKKEHYWDDIWPEENRITLKIARADKIFEAFEEWQEKKKEKEQKLQDEFQNEFQEKQVFQEQVTQKHAGKGFWNRIRTLFARV
jgi:hypothetical protein